MSKKPKKISDLNDTDIAEIAEIYWDRNIPYDERISRLSKLIGKSNRTVAKWVNDLGITEKGLIESPQYIKAKERKFDKNKKRFIITWAQNDTPIHKNFIKNIEAYANYINADIHIIAGRYKNPTSIFTDKNYETWDKEIIGYLDAGRHDIHKYVSIMSDIKIQPTAVDPMTGLQSITGINSCIFGSPKVQLETISVLNNPKVMMTTGACTIKNYTDSKAGKKGEFHHTLGFSIIEIKNEDMFFLRQVTATDDGNFSDLYYNVIDGDVFQNKNIEGIVLGDLHYGEHDEKVFNKTLEFIKYIKPKNIILHDVFNGTSVNHHDLNDPIIQYQKEINGTNNLKQEIENLLDGLSNFKDYNVIVVRSNHDDFLDRWIKNNDWRKGPTMKNSKEYLEYGQILLENKAPNGIIQYLIKERYPQFQTLGRNDSFIVNGWEVGQHGDFGSNGSRGSLNQFRKMNTKIILGHYHSPSRKDGAISVGTSTKLRLDYNLGASNWLQSHVIIHNNGKAQHIIFIDGEFSTFDYNE